MEKYDSIGVVGEGSYGLVMKCRHRETGQLVAIKKFLETEDDLTVRKMALREIRMLKRLRHENLVNMLEAFRRRRRYYLVFEFMDHTILDELEATCGGLGEKKCREYIFQVVRGVDFCHSNNIIHRDVKPENVLVSASGVIKLCDFGFARLLTGAGETYTDYVATRWYRAPELLVPDPHYGKAVDIWAIGCLFAEMMTGDPLFPGDSDIDQLFLIIRVMGKLSHKHQQLIMRNPMFKGLKRNEDGVRSLSTLFPNWQLPTLDFLGCCLKMDPQLRPISTDLLRHLYLTKDNFTEQFLPELRQRILQEFQCNPLLRKFQGSAPRKGRELPEGVDDKTISMRRCSFIEPTRWKITGTEEARRPSVELTRLVGSSNSRPETMETVVDEVESRQDGRSARDASISLSPLQPPQAVLHPSVSFLGFQPEISKHSPLPPSTRTMQFGQPARRTQLVRRLDRPIDSTLYGNYGETVISPQPWFANKRGPSRETPAWRTMKNLSRGALDEEFTLPNLPGATYSPQKGVKKKITNIVMRDDDLLSPSRNKTPSAGSRTRGNNSFPYM